jgi:predicted NUDIX family NTP pyrophosphohydrolase
LPKERFDREFQAFFRRICTVIESAGLVVYRGTGDQLAVLLVHPSGNYNRRAPWGIPKGLLDENEPLTAAAVRETREETGVALDDEQTRQLVPLGFVEYKRSRKRIHAFAAPAPAGAEPKVASWEVDRAEFLSIAEARRRIHPDQLPLLDRLVEYLAMGGDRAD